MLIKILTLILIVSSPLTDKGWELVKSGEGVYIYNRKIDGTKIKEFKAEMILDEKYFEKIYHVLQDVENYRQWMDRCVESKLIKKEENILYCYQVYSAPWPVRARDNGAKIVYNRSEDLITVAVSNEPEIYPVQKKKHRIQEFRARWRIEKIGNGQMKVEEIVWYDPGAIPAFIVNMATVDAPYNTFTGLKKYLGV